ncbi:hypothetical protein BH11ACT1_BH11ACT1_20500 [soil metagenome]
MTGAGDTHCPYCALQCAMQLTPVDAAGSPPDANPVTVTGREFPTNRGGLCQKGWTSASLLRTPDRLTTPLLRTDGRLRPATWDEALGFVARRLRELRAESGPATVAVFGGGALTNEKAYTLGKFARAVLATPNIDYNGRFCMASAAAGANRTLGIDRGLPFPLEDLGGAQAVLLLGSNLAETMPPSVQHLAGARAAGGLVVVDPRRSATADLTSDGRGTHVQPVPGTDLVVLLALTHVVPRRGCTTRRTSSGVRPGWTTCAARSRRGGPSVPSRSAGFPPRRCVRSPGSSRPRRRRAAERAPTC